MTKPSLQQSQIDSIKDPIGLWRHELGEDILENLLQRPIFHQVKGGVCRILRTEQIVWGTDSSSVGVTRFRADAPITLEKLKELGDGFCPRACKAKDERVRRVRQKAEVFTPAWVCASMTEYLDEEWFGRKEIFIRRTDKGYEALNGDVDFGSNAKQWQRYVKSPRLEITCGEAPFIAMRYDAVTGAPIAIKDRVGILDRKLKVVTQFVQDPQEWLHWALKAVRSVYGYEWQGDSLFLARLNIVATFVEYFRDRFEDCVSYDAKAFNDTLKEVAQAVVLNFWQMNGVTGLFPYAKTHDVQGDLFSTDWNVKSAKSKSQQDDRGFDSPIYVCTWNSPKYVLYKDIRMKFDYVIGNPPYQEEIVGSNLKRPVYCDMMDAAYKIGTRVEMITPGRFLFRAGSTSDDWDTKMLSDPHLKVLEYSPDSKTYFQDVDIKGGVVITYRNSEADYEPIEVFIAFDELRGVYKKASPYCQQGSIDDIIFGYLRWNKSTLFADHPEIRESLSANVRDRKDMTSNAFEVYPIFQTWGGGDTSALSA
ncbi:MAG: Eco57I restriction-modification methylase domain-containing protein [Planctomycetia bacterium]|nr:Eco57I restriction-modification methylase domain-containing protein [Planctomycetia bacterium]